MVTEEKKRVRLLYAGDRIVNFRPILLLAAAFGLGILFFWLWGAYALFGNLCFVPAAAAALVLKARKKRRARGLLVFSAVLCAVYTLGALSLFLHLGAFERAPAVEGECTVVGVVEEIGTAGYGDVLTLRDIVLVTEDGSEIEPDMKLTLYAPSSDVQIGMTVYAEADVTTYDVQSYGRINTSALLGGIRYRAESNEVYIAGESGEGVFDAVRGRVREVLFDSLDEETAPIAYAMLLGDSGYMDEDVLQNFRYGGVAHIFAVSGLHIGIVYGLLSALLKKLRVNRWVRLFAAAAVLVFYAGVCGFSPSSVRALVMCLVVSLADAAGCAYDKLNSVSLAALAVLLVNPVYLFSVGFQLSLAAAAGIIVLGGHLLRLLARVRFLPKKLGSALAVCFSAQVCTFPILLDCFGYASVLGLFLNLVFIPVISMVYSVLFVTAAVSAILPFAAGVLLFVPGYLLEVAVTPILMLEFKVLLICGFSFGGLSALFYGGLYLCSDKVNLRAAPRAAAVGFLCLLLTACMLFRNGAFTQGDTLTLHSYYGDNNLLLLRSGEQIFLIATGSPDAAYLERLFLQEGISSLDGLVVLADESEANAALPVVLQYAAVRALYVPEGSALDGSFRTVEVVCSDEFPLGNVTACFYGEEILVLCAEGTTTVIAAEGAEFSEPLPHADLLVSDCFDELFFLACTPAEEIYFRKTEGKNSVYAAGSLQIQWNGGIISVTQAR